VSCSFAVVEGVGCWMARVEVKPSHLEIVLVNNKDAFGGFGVVAVWWANLAEPSEHVLNSIKFCDDTCLICLICVPAGLVHLREFSLVG
jgi:hypothetical protein